MLNFIHTFVTNKIQLQKVKIAQDHIRKITINLKCCRVKYRSLLGSAGEAQRSCTDAADSLVRKEQTLNKAMKSCFLPHSSCFPPSYPITSGNEQGDLGSTYHVHQRIHHLSCHLNPWQCSASSTPRYYGVRDLLEKAEKP